MVITLSLQVLCELFQSAPQRSNMQVSGNISGFIRRLFLQLMLEDEKVSVFLQSPCPVGWVSVGAEGLGCPCPCPYVTLSCPLQLYKGRINATCHLIQHPMYGAGHKYRTLHLPISTTLAEVLDRVSGEALHPGGLGGGHTSTGADWAPVHLLTGHQYTCPLGSSTPADWAPVDLLTGHQ